MITRTFRAQKGERFFSRDVATALELSSSHRAIPLIRQQAEKGAVKQDGFRGTVMRFEALEDVVIRRVEPDAIHDLSLNLKAFNYIVSEHDLLGKQRAYVELMRLIYAKLLEELEE